jgi:membrane associated rhomboid family serine protease
MLPVCDVIPPRTQPYATLTLIAVSVGFGLAAGAAGGPLALSSLCLWLFGWTVEDRLGRARFLTMFLACGVLAWSISSPDEAVDGAVAGVLGAYFVLYPRSIVLMLVPAPPLLVEVPAVVCLSLWFLIQILIGPFAPQLAGLAAGAALGMVLRRAERMRVEWWSP